LERVLELLKMEILIPPYFSKRKVVIFLKIFLQTSVYVLRENFKKSTCINIRKSNILSICVFIYLVKVKKKTI